MPICGYDCIAGMLGPIPPATISKQWPAGASVANFHHNSSRDWCESISRTCSVWTRHSSNALIIAAYCHVTWCHRKYCTNRSCKPALTCQAVGRLTGRLPSSPAWSRHPGWVCRRRSNRRAEEVGVCDRTGSAAARSPAWWASGPPCNRWSVSATAAPQRASATRP